MWGRIKHSGRAQQHFSSLAGILKASISLCMGGVLIPIILLFPIICFSQSGPGGVGRNDGMGDLSLWLDASQISGLDDLDPMGTWVDQSGNGYDALVGSAPTYSATGGGNGMPTVTFDNASNQYMYIPTNIEIMPTNEVSVFVAGNYESSSDNWASLISCYDDDAGNDGWAFERDNGNDRLQFYVDGWDNGCLRNFSSGQEEVWSIVFNTSDNTIYANLSEDECTDGLSGPINYNGGTNDDVLIGTGTDNSGPAYFMDGDIAEIIIYDVAVNEAQRIIISNYLAAKYNISLTNNDCYDEDDNGDYDHDVAGIGRVDASNIHSDSRGTGIVRVQNPTDLNNDEFFMWGHDNGDAIATETSDVPGGGDPVDARFERVWRVSEARATTGAGRDVGSVDMLFDLSGKGNITAGDLRLLVDTDNDGIFSDETPISGASLVSGDIYQFDAVSSITNNDRFTIGTANALRTPLSPVGPGGVSSNLVLWLKANSGTTGSPTVTAWEDQSFSQNDASGYGDPQLVSNGINYNPAIDFDVVGDYFETGNSSLIGSDNPYTKLAIITADDTTINDNIISSGIGGDHAMFYISSSNPLLFHNGSSFSGPGIGQLGSPAMVANRYGSGGPDNFSRTNGVSTVNNTAYSFTDGGPTQIGNFVSSTNGEHDGYIAEAIMFNKEVSDVELSKIESYLAMKYSITLDNSAGGTAGDLYASDGTLIWDASANATHHNDLIAIARDDSSSFQQKQSHSQDDSLIVYLSSLASNNEGNSGSITNDRSFLVIGNDKGTLQATSASLANVPTGITSRLARQWKVVNTNFADSYSIEFEWDSVGGFDINDIRLLVDDDGDFSDATVFGTSDGLTFTKGSIIVSGITTSHIPANSIRIITLGSISTDSPLPIQDINLSAEPISDQKVELTWTRTMEIGCKRFEIQRSEKDGNWIRIAQQNHPDPFHQSFQESDYPGSPGNYLYRVIQYDEDGRMAVSNIQAVQFDPGETDEPKIFPNPTDGWLNISSAMLPAESLVLRNIQGQDLTSLVNPQKTSETAIRLDLNNLANGVYFIQMGSFSRKIVKQ